MTIQDTASVICTLDLSKYFPHCMTKKTLHKHNCFINDVCSLCWKPHGAAAFSLISITMTVMYSKGNFE